jgi:flagellar hook-basal body complex protein FliE
LNTVTEHQAAAALLNQAIHAVNDLWLEADGDDKPFLDEAISKLHEAQSLMMKARLRVDSSK